MRRLACIAFTEQGARLAERVEAALTTDASGPWEVTVARGFGPGRETLADWTRAHFCGDPAAGLPADDALLFVGATGIAVRAVGPLASSKASDAAVVVMDAAGRWVIPLLSGHIGGANRLATRVAETVGATPVLTTATDELGLWAVDDWAVRAGLAVANPDAIKAVAAKLLSGGEARVWSCLPFRDEPPAHVALVGDPATADVVISPLRPARLAAAGLATAGLATASLARGAVATCEEAPACDPSSGDEGARAPLWLVPRAVSVGVGCRRGVGERQVEEAWGELARETGLDDQAVAEVRSVDLKAREPGLLAFCAAHGWRLRTYAADELARVEGTFTHASEFVRRVTGVDNVCERAAQLGGARALAPRFVHDGVTLALGLIDERLSFGDPESREAR